MGDFNLIYKDQDKSNGKVNRNLMLRLKRIIDHLEVKEINLTEKGTHGAIIKPIQR
jgi:hypothetical protein